MEVHRRVSYKVRTSSSYKEACRVVRYWGSHIVQTVVSQVAARIVSRTGRPLRPRYNYISVSSTSFCEKLSTPQGLVGLITIVSRVPRLCDSMVWLITTWVRIGYRIYSQLRFIAAHITITSYWHNNSQLNTRWIISLDLLLQLF
jgi:hypothetical protein